jgi:arylformamidase
LRTRNSAIWQRGDREFHTDFVALTVEAAQWVVARGIRLIGVDYLSVQIFQGDPQTHIALLQAGSRDRGRFEFDRSRTGTL